MTDIAPPKPPPKVYLGDGAYAEFNNHQIILTAEDGTPIPTNTVYLDDRALRTLLRNLPSHYGLDALIAALQENQQQ